MDLIDALTREHDEIRRLCTAVDRSHDEERGRRFADFSRVVRRHEFGEREVVHPAARDASALGRTVGRDRMVESHSIERSLDTLDALGTGDPGFGDGFAALRQAVLEHLTRKEVDEFPLLRRHVPVQRLHGMAGELHDVRVLAAN
ncbi:hemerythrin domain-containing protein [Actinoplanes utahensis]|uniref:hemerythrin domain-containing protein n=1 Tax=Actinoplanes utahensis TaxID=1869 RepID=UPI000ADE59E6|nr:hemerythrin domain-containing protein [Actinoplanes utahensis]GIF35481.1 hypothetical protein Aut01nite_84670 [Actinoplanes utahensis]